ncbi:MAG: hypothetical protein Q8Q13_01040 [bacterium]|nr:hypothetical protein [bacterium]
MNEYNPVNQTSQTPPVQPEKPVTRPQVSMPDPSTRSGAGSIIGAIIIILLLAAGAFYFWGAKLNGTDTNPPPLILGNETAGADASSDVASGLPPQQTSDDEAAINADIQAMNIDQLNAQNDASLQTYGTDTQ